MAAMSMYHLSNRRIKKAIRVVAEGYDDWGKPRRAVISEFTSKYGVITVRCLRDYPGVRFAIEVGDDYAAIKYLSFEADEMKRGYIRLASLWTDMHYLLPACIVKYFILTAEKL